MYSKPFFLIQNMLLQFKQTGTNKNYIKNYKLVFKGFGRTLSTNKRLEISIIYILESYSLSKNRVVWG